MIEVVEEPVQARSGGTTSFLFSIYENIEMGEDYKYREIFEALVRLLYASFLLHPGV